MGSIQRPSRMLIVGLFSSFLSIYPQSAKSGDAFGVVFFCGVNRLLKDAFAAGGEKVRS